MEVLAHMDDPTDLVRTSAPDVQALSSPLTHNPVLLYLASLQSEGSRRTQGGALRQVCRACWRCEPEEFPWHKLGYPELVALRSYLAEHGGALATAKRKLGAVLRVLYFARKLGLMTEANYRAAIDIEQIRGARLSPGRALTQGELRAIFSELATGTAIDARNAALIAVLYGGGLRRSESIALDRGDVDLATGAVRVRGKGNKERRSFLPLGARSALRAWLKHRGDEAGPLFWATDHGGELVHRRLSNSGVGCAVASVGQRAGVCHFSAHDLRRTFVSDLLHAKADLATVQHLAGHASPTTTSHYDRRGDNDKAEAVDLLCVPFVEGEPKPATGRADAPAAPTAADLRERYVREVLALWEAEAREAARAQRFAATAPAELSPAGVGDAGELEHEQSEEGNRGE